MKFLSIIRKHYTAIAGVALCATMVTVFAHEPHEVPPFGDQPLLFQHTPQDALTRGIPPYDSFDFINNIGIGLFVLPHNTLGGLGRPAATGNATPTRREALTDAASAFSRLSGVDSTSCVGCHALPNIGAAGDFAVNNFEGAELSAQPENILKSGFNERSTPAIQGAGAIELLGREMTQDLFAIRDKAIETARRSGKKVRLPLVSKTVSFGFITAYPNGKIGTREVEGVDEDLIIKPFGRKGTTRSLREFTVNGLNRHHGLQAVERYGVEQTGTKDFDEDGVEDELSVGDVTALVIFQAQLETPVQQLPPTPAAQRAATAGEALFTDLACAHCHRPRLKLENTRFCEPYALNTPGTFADTSQSFCFDLTTTGAQPRIAPGPNGGAEIRAFTDLKRHRICDAKNTHFCNERTPERGVAPDQFITSKLWHSGVGKGLHSHRGDISTLNEVILAHGGEATVSRNRYQALNATQQASVVEFLKTLQIPVVAPPPIQLPLGLTPLSASRR